MPHIRVDSWKTATLDKFAGNFEEVGPERTLKGTFQERAWEAGTKLEGSTELRFEGASGGSWQALNRPKDAAIGREVTVRAREVVLSRFVAHAGGPTLWIVSLEP